MQKRTVHDPEPVFDDYWDSAYTEKLMGVADRKKWRVRIYNYSDAGIRLERKKRKQLYL